MLCGAAGPAASAEARDPDDAPPLAPEDEMRASNPEFETVCLNKFVNMVIAQHLVLGKRVMTHSKAWGWVWRVDFQFDKEPSSFVDRILCWRTPEGRLDIIFAFGQQIAPL